MTDKKFAHLGFLQMEISCGNVKENLEKLVNAVESRRFQPNTLVVLPELWASGFAYNAFQEIEREIGNAVVIMEKLARENQLYFAGSIPQRAEGSLERYSNTLIVAGAEGICGTYRKNHVFPGEEIAFEGYPENPQMISTPDGNIGAMVCYDLRFPDISRTFAQQGADVLICSAQWPLARLNHWRSLMIARAIENQIYIVGCNATGYAGDIQLGGGSLIVSPQGEILVEAGKSPETVSMAVDWFQINQARERFLSFTVDRRILPALAKVRLPEDCAIVAEKRATLGQKVIFAEIGQGTMFLDELERLAGVRRQCDFLIIGVDCARAALYGSIGKLGIILKRYAALANVSLVCDLGLMTDEVQTKLNQFCEIVTIS